MAEEKSELQAGFVLVAYFVALLILGATWWKAAAIGLVLGTAYGLEMGASWIARAAVVLLVVAFTVWVDLLPAPSQMKVLVAEQLDGVRTWQCSRQASVGHPEQNPR